jgi:hypothetical protein
MGISKLERVITAQRWCGERLVKNIGDLFKTDDVLLAGGMVRDWYFNREGKDYDIYIEMPEGLGQMEAFMMLAGAGILENASIMSRDDAGSQGYADAAIEMVVEGIATESHSNHLPPPAKGDPDPPTIVQVIFIKHFTVPVVNYVRDFFCCSLSKVWMNINGNTSYHEDFVDSIRDKKIIFNWDYAASEINLEYVKKVLRYFPDYDTDEDTLGNFRRQLSASYMSDYD